MGIDEHFTCTDRWVTLGIFFWSVFWFLVFIVGSIWYLIHSWSALTWAYYWLVTNIYLALAVSILTTIWFTIGCWNDLILFFQRLASKKINTHDDGSVEHPGDRPH